MDEYTPNEVSVLYILIQNYGLDKHTARTVIGKAIAKNEFKFENDRTENVAEWIFSNGETFMINHEFIMDTES